MKEQLHTDIKHYLKQKWEALITDQLAEVLELRPDNAFGYIFEKSILKLKSDSPISPLLIDLTLFCVYCDPLVLGYKAFEDRIFNLCVEKHNHQRVKKTDFKKLLEAICLQLEPSEKDYLIQTLLQEEKLTVPRLTQLLYYTALYCRAINELHILNDSLDECNTELNSSLLSSYLQSQPSSYLSKLVQRPEEKLRLESLYRQMVDRIRNLP